MRGGGKGMVLEWRGLECFVCFGQGPSVLQGQGLQGLAQLPPSLHGDWENGALQPCHGGISPATPLEAAGGCFRALDEILEVLDELGNLPFYLGLVQVFACRCQGGTVPCGGCINPPGWGACRRWGQGSGNAQHLGVWGDVGAAPPGSVSTLPGAVSWVQRGQACAGLQGFIPSFLGAPRLWQPLPMNPHSLSRIQRVQGWLEKGAVPPQCPGAEPAGPCSALPEPTFGLWGGSITPGLVWSLQGPSVATGLTRSWNPAGVARAGDVRK